MAIKCILFDADGVVINSERFSLQYQKKHNVTNDEMLPFFKGDFQKCIVGKADLIELVKPWLPKWKWGGTVEEFLQFWFNVSHNVDEQMVEIIKKLRKKGVKCYIATNQEKYRTQYMRENMRFEDLFDHVFSSAEIGYKKPDREFYEFILNKMKNKHKIYHPEIMFFDDSQKNVDEAKKLDIEAHFYKSFEEFESIVKPILEDLTDDAGAP